MLAGDFFDIQSFAETGSVGSELHFSIIARLNAEHPIFKGHFPDNPIVPGVCQVQMVKELVEKALNHSVRLYESDNIKFLSMINPLEFTSIEFDIRIKTIADNQFATVANIGSGTSIFLKFKGKFEFE